MISKRKFKGATIIELTTSIVLIGLIFTISLLTYSNISNSGSTIRSAKNYYLLKSIALEVIENQHYVPEKVYVDGLEITKELIVDPKNQSLITLKVTALDSRNVLVGHFEKIIYVKD